MATTYTYSLSGDFGTEDDLNSFQLVTEINANVGITVTCDYINTVGDDVDIVFASALSAGEQTLLDTDVTNHIPAIEVGRFTLSMTTEIIGITSTSYISVGTVVFPGTTDADVTHIKIIAEMDSGGTSYDVRVLNNDNGLTVASGNFNNEDQTVLDLGAVSNLSAGESILDVQVKVNGATEVDFHNMAIKYE